MLSSHKYITTVPFSGLFNWSVQYLNETKISFNATYPMVRIGDFLMRNKTQILIQDDVTYKRVTIRVRNGGVVKRDEVEGKNIGTKRQYLVSEGQFILSKIDARNGAMGIIPAELEGAIVTQEFLPYDFDLRKINPQYLVLVSTTQEFIEFCQTCSSGTTNRQRIEEVKFLDIKIPLPSLEEQNELVNAYNTLITLAAEQEALATHLQSDIQTYIYDKLGLSKSKDTNNKGLKLVSYRDIQEWGTDKIVNSSNFSSKLFNAISLEQSPNLVIDAFRGKSPKYDTNSLKSILNQKCVRWNSIEVVWAKSVNEKWLSNIDDKFLTKYGDILVNSTGEGTIGRSSIVKEKYAGLLYDSHVLLLRLDSDMLNPNYYVEVFNSEYGQCQVNSIKSAQTTKQTELGINNLLKIKVPLPSIQIQNEIVEHINSLKEQIKTLRTQATENRSTALKNFKQKIF